MLKRSECLDGFGGRVFKGKIWHVWLSSDWLVVRLQGSVLGILCSAWSYHCPYENLSLSLYPPIHLPTYVTETLCCTPETNTILWINYTSIKKKKSQDWGPNQRQCGNLKKESEESQKGVQNFLCDWVWISIVEYWPHGKRRRMKSRKIQERRPAVVDSKLDPPNSAPNSNLTWRQVSQVLWPCLW